MFYFFETFRVEKIAIGESNQQEFGKGAKNRKVLGQSQKIWITAKEMGNLKRYEQSRKIWATEK